MALTSVFTNGPATSSSCLSAISTSTGDAIRTSGPDFGGDRSSTGLSISMSSRIVLRGVSTEQFSSMSMPKCSTGFGVISPSVVAAGTGACNSSSSLSSARVSWSSNRASARCLRSASASSDMIFSSIRFLQASLWFLLPGRSRCKWMHPAQPPVYPCVKKSRFCNLSRRA